jgi:serine/threonine protein kinase
MGEKQREFEAGDTNETYLDSDGKVVKKYRDHSFANLLYGATNVVIGIRWRFLDAEKRMRNEMEFADATSDLSINSPTPEPVSENTITYSYIEGDSFDVFAEENPVEARRYAEQIGDYIVELRENGVACGDLFPENFLVSDDGLHRIDNEWANMRPDGFDYWLEDVLLLSGLLTLSARAFESVTDGLRDSEFDGFTIYAVFAAVSLAAAYSLVFEKSLEEFGNSLTNVFRL